ncbi:MAG: serine O-acetyltransferase [Methylococcaceae bacterium NSP1-1]|nr:MAG: serine O-acetyltransferase [Methylococcaceae bacterium NSP1-1]
MNDTTYLNGKYDWGIDEIVAQLSDLRVQSLETRSRRDKPPKLPSRKELQLILDGLGAVLFPNRLGLPDLNDEGIDYFVGHTLETLLRKLYKQISRELHFNSGHQGVHIADHERAIIIARQFAAQLPAVRRLLDSDIQAAYEGDPAASSPDEVLVCYPGITAIIHHRLALHPGAQIGDSFFIDHGTGVVIGETAVIGRHVRVYQAVTLGAKRFLKDDNGVLVKGNVRHPIVEDDVVIYAGATILGRITIGRGSTIGGNVWLTHSVPPDSNITQAHVRSELFHGGAGI